MARSLYIGQKKVAIATITFANVPVAIGPALSASTPNANLPIKLPSPIKLNTVADAGKPSPVPPASNSVYAGKS